MEQGAEATETERKRRLGRIGLDSSRSLGEETSSGAPREIVSVFIEVNDVRVVRLDPPHVVAVLAFEAR